METDKDSMWSADEVEAILTLRADGSLQDQLISAVRNEKVFHKISADTTNGVYNWTPKQCWHKILKAAIGVGVRFAQMENESILNRVHRKHTSKGTVWFDM